MTARFADRLLEWYDRCGRHDLPWQRDRDAYKVWVSEIMLQQTQVATVVPYFERFVARFPTVRALADAGLDEVLALWAGLGYYARARNLHRAAGIVAQRFDGVLPRSIEELTALPGIGRSTAGAILSLAYGERHAILDGNVKRVLARYHAIEGWPGESLVAAELWQRAEQHTPHVRAADYTQAIMDLGATLCTRSRPACILCPVAEGCRARRLGTAARLPAPRPKRERPRRAVTLLVIRDAEGRVLLERRPQAGIWGGLFSLPEQSDARFAAMSAGMAAHTPGAPFARRRLPALQHAFTHFDLTIEPLLIEVTAGFRSVMDDEDVVWYNAAAESDCAAIGMPAPVAALLAALPPRASPPGRSLRSLDEETA